MYVDIIGVVKSTGDVMSITTRQTNRKVSKRDVQLMDRSEKVVQLTLWGAEAEGFDGSNNPVLAIRGAKVSDFGGVCVCVCVCVCACVCVQCCLQVCAKVVHEVKVHAVYCLEISYALCRSLFIHFELEYGTEEPGYSRGP